MRADILLTAILPLLGATASLRGVHPRVRKLQIRDASSTFAGESFVQTERFSSGCSPGGCILDFRFSAKAGYVNGAPAFNASCVLPGNSPQKFHCDNSVPLLQGVSRSDVYLNWTHPTSDGYGLRVIHEYKAKGLGMFVVAAGNITMYQPGYDTTKLPVITVSYL